MRGEKLSPSLIKNNFRDHPRVRGEKHREVAPCTDLEGSPPRARGKVHGIIKHILGDGITPACAGKRP